VVGERDVGQPYSIARVRSSAVVFLTAKGLTAPLSLAIFLLIAARLPKPEFALYAWLLAFGQFSDQFSYLGLDWVALHHIPNYRSRIGGQSYRLFVVGLAGLRLGVVAALIGTYLVVAPHLVAAFGQSTWLHPFRLYLGVMVAELMLKFVRWHIFEPLLEQGRAQGNVLLQHVVFLGLLLMSSTRGASISIEAVIYAKGVAAWVALLVALGQLVKLLRQPVPAVSGEPPPGLRFLLGFALDNFAQDLMRLMSTGPLLTLLASRLVGVSALATYGFAANLTEFLSRALPTQLFLGLLRPRFIAEYVTGRSVDRLRARIALLLKTSMTVVAVSAAVLLAVGRGALDLLSDGKYSASYGVLLAFLLWLVLNAMRTMQAALTNVLGHSRFLRRASLSSLLVVPAAVALVAAGAGPYGLIFAMLLGETVFVWLVTIQLLREGYRLPFDAHGYSRIVGAGLTAALAGRAAVQVLPAGWVAVGGGGAVTLAMFAAAVRILRPFALEERTAIEHLVGHRVVLL